MAKPLRHTKSGTKEVQRLLCHHIDQALKALQGNQPLSDAAVHGARKQLKQTPCGRTRILARCIPWSPLQRHLLQHQVDTFLDLCSTCPDCGALLKVKAHASRSFRTLFGTCKLDSPRLAYCDCTRHKTSSFRPLSAAAHRVGRP